MTETWHRRLGIGFSKRAIVSQVRAGVLPNVKSTTAGDYETCVKWKYCNSFSGSLTDFTFFGHRDADAKGKVQVTSFKGKKYFATILDAFSSFVFTAPVKKKSDLKGFLLKYIC